MALHTRTKILDAFLELANQYPEKKHFTFTEIAKQAGVSRQAIYKRHFNSVDEIINYIRRKTVSSLQAPLPDSPDMNPFTAFAQTVIPSVYEQQHWIRTLYTSSVDPLWRDFLIDSYQEWTLQHLDIQQDKTGLSRELTARIFAEWICSLIENWIIQENPLAPEDFAKVFLKLVSTPLINFTAYGNDLPSANKIIIS